MDIMNRYINMIYLACEFFFNNVNYSFNVFVDGTCSIGDSEDKVFKYGLETLDNFVVQVECEYLGVCRMGCRV